MDLLRTFVLVLGLVICFGLGFAFGPLGVLLALFVAMFIGFAVIER